MQNSKSPNNQFKLNLPGKTRGFNLVESIVASVILTVGLLGFANLQQQSMRSIQHADNANAAANLAAEMAVRITTNGGEASKGKSSAYIKSFSSINSSINGFETKEGENTDDTAFLNGLLPSISKCYSMTGCSSKEQAVADLFEWKSQLKQILPNAEARICFDSKLGADDQLTCDDIMSIQNNSIAYTIKITWDNIKGSRDSYTMQVLADLNSEQANAVANGDPIGTVVSATGLVTASTSDQTPRAMTKDSNIYVADLFNTADNSNVQIKLNDGSIISLQSNTKFRIDKFNFNLSAPIENINIMTLIIGGFKTLTGFIADQTPDNYQVKTDLATLGVRGTYWGAVFLADVEGAPLNISVWDDPRVNAKKSVVVIKNDATMFEIGAGKTFKNAIIPDKTVPIEGSYYQSPDFEPVTWITPEAKAITAVDIAAAKSLDPNYTENTDVVTSPATSTTTTSPTTSSNTSDTTSGSSTTSGTSTSDSSTAGSNTSTSVNDSAVLAEKNAQKVYLYKKYMNYYKQFVKDKKTGNKDRYLQHYNKYKKDYEDEMSK